MAQLGDFARAKALLRRAGRGFGSREPLARARCLVAEVEIGLATRELNWSTKSLDAARAMLEKGGDRANAAQARYLEVRRLVLIGRLEQAGNMLSKLDPGGLPSQLRVVHELASAAIATRGLRIQVAREAITRAGQAAREAAIPALAAEVAGAARVLAAPAARVIAGGKDRLLRLEEVERLLESGALIVDACRLAVRDATTVVPLPRRPVLFALVRALGEAWPLDVSRDVLVARTFRAKRADESYRARLRVEVGRLRGELRRLAAIRATRQGFALVPAAATEVVVLAPPVEDVNAAVLAHLADGEFWSSSALALALGTGQRTMQRALEELAARGKVQAVGRGRARRWATPPPPGFTTTLLLPVPIS